MAKKIFIVPCMSCNHCKMAISQELKQLTGLDKFEINLDTKEVLVEGDFTDDKIKAAIKEAGYEVEKVVE
ncbi:MAG: cation transporter [Calditrichia bacterium]